MEKIIKLKCACCGTGTFGRQWHNRDRGFGLCSDCIEFAAEGISEDEMRDCYGVKGVHYGLSVEAQ